MKQTLTKINVVPAPNDEGFAFVIMEKGRFFWKEIGRCHTLAHLEKFSKQYVLKTGQTLQDVAL